MEFSGSAAEFRIIRKPNGSGTPGRGLFLHWGISSALGDVWYLHVSWVWDGVVEVKDPRQPEEVTLLRSAEATPWTPTADGFQFELPLCRMSSLGEVIKVVWEKS